MIYNGIFRLHKFYLRKNMKYEKMALAIFQNPGSRWQIIKGAKTLAKITQYEMYGDIASSNKC